MLLLTMIRVQYFVNFVGDVAVIVTNFLFFCGLMDFKQPLKCHYF